MGIVISDYLAQQRRCTLILSDVEHDGLKQRAKQLRSRHKVEVHTIAQDMLLDEGAEQLFARATAITSIDAMINCMGLTHLGRSDTAHIARISRINFIAASELTVLFIRYFIEKKIVAAYCI